MKYTIQVDAEQARVIKDALDLLSRLAMGQMDNIKFIPHYADGIDTVKLNDLVEDLSNQFKSVGIRNNSEQGKIAHDIMAVIRHRLAWDRDPSGGNTVDFNTPMAYSECEKVIITDESEADNRDDKSESAVRAMGILITSRDVDAALDEFLGESREEEITMTFAEHMQYKAAGNEDYNKR